MLSSIDISPSTSLNVLLKYEYQGVLGRYWALILLSRYALPIQVPQYWGKYLFLGLVITPNLSGINSLVNRR